MKIEVESNKHYCTKCLESKKVIELIYNQRLCQECGSEINWNFNNVVHNTYNTNNDSSGIGFFGIIFIIIILYLLWQFILPMILIGWLFW